MMVNGTEVVTGTVGVCRNGVLSGYCDDGTIFDGAAQQFCNVLGYVCKCIYTFYRYNLSVTYPLFLIHFSAFFSTSSFCSFSSPPPISSLFFAIDGEKVTPSGSGLPRGAYFFTNFTCTLASRFCYTNSQLNTDPACYNGTLDYTVQCSNSPTCKLK